MWSIFDVIVFAAGFVVCWLTKDRVIMSYDDTASFVRRLKAKIKSIWEAL